MWCHYTYLIRFFCIFFPCHECCAPHIHMIWSTSTTCTVSFWRSIIRGDVQLSTNATGRVIEIYVMLNLYPVVYDVSNRYAVCLAQLFSNWPCVAFTRIWKRESPVSIVIYRFATFSSQYFSSFIRFLFRWICFFLSNIVQTKSNSSHMIYCHQTSKWNNSMSWLDFLAHQFGC